MYVLIIPVWFWPELCGCVHTLSHNHRAITSRSSTPSTRSQLSARSIAKLTFENLETGMKYTVHSFDWPLWILTMTFDWLFGKTTDRKTGSCLKKQMDTLRMIFSIWFCFFTIYTYEAVLSIVAKFKSCLNPRLHLWNHYFAHENTSKSKPIDLSNLD